MKENDINKATLNFQSTKYPHKFKINDDKSISLKGKPNHVLGVVKYDEKEWSPSFEDLGVLLS